MSYTDDTVYRLRDIIDGYTEVALEYRTEEEKKELFLNLIQKNQLDLPNSFEVVGKPYEESADKIITFLEECIFDYREKKKSLTKIRQENQEIEKFLQKNNISCEGIFVKYPEI